MKKNIQEKRGRGLALLIFVLFANLFIFHAFGTVALSLVLIGLWLLLSFVFGRIDLGKSMMIVGTIGLMSFVGSPEKIVLLLILSLVMMTVFVYSFLKSGETEGILELFLSPFIVFREYVTSTWRLMKGTLSGKLLELLDIDVRAKERSPWVKSTLIGFILGLPIVAWLVSTLSNADPVFSAFVKGILSEKFLNEIPARFVFSAFIMALLIPLLIMKWRGYHSPLGWLTKAKWGREMITVTVMVCAVLGLFLMVQWPYVFASVAREVDLSKFGVATYSEYVQKGFGDLLKVVIMVFGISWVGYLINKNQTGFERKYLILAQAFLGIEFIIFVISIFRRVWLYQSYHGLSIARIYGLVLLVVIMGMSVTMALRYLGKNIKWVKVEIAWILFVLMMTLGLNPEKLVVKYPPTVNGRIDYVYLSRLPGDGYLGWIKSLDWSSETLKKYSPQKDYFDVEHRREIYYADMSMRNLAKNYHELIMQYGTDTEINNYFAKVIENKQEIVKGFTVESFSYTKVNGSSEKIKKVEYLAKMGELKNQLASSSWKEKVDVSIQPLGTYFRAWEWMKAKPSMDIDITYYEINSGKESELRLKYDKLMSWNYRRYEIFKMLYSQGFENKILENQKIEMEILQKIGLQPENQRGFEMDISLESPFLR